MVKGNSDNDALVTNTNNDKTDGDCVELQKEIEEALKVLMNDCGEQNEELLSLSDHYCAAETVSSNLESDYRNNGQDNLRPNDNYIKKPATSTIMVNQEADYTDTAQPGTSGISMTNQDNDEDFVSNESDYEESEDDLDMSQPMEKENSDKEDSGPENNEIETIEEEYVEISRRKRKRKADTACWKRQECKIKREKGEKYDELRKNTDGKWTTYAAKPPRKMKHFCNFKMSGKSLKIRCRFFTEEDR
ncbi:uncharacterized protein LOC115877021 [Sitophilus oryzae]|uniref:Uncharacterized protein LOC115877021 n=1 Tax=Sitophilus oryzae TaxID=7048 RepID=A0A6J2XDT0_SITOR|nr:uncharacterized protein LOC115877021 [Sitophilus oryzae]